jgi:hypothetical protein
MTLPRWKDLLSDLPLEGSFEVVLHPGADDAAARASHRWGYSWEEESVALESPELASLLAERGVERVPFSRLAG